MKNYFDHIKIFIYRFLLLVAIFSISRFLFYLFNLNYFDSIKTIELLKIMFFGIRFDLSALYYFNILFILLSLIPGDFKNSGRYQNILLILFLVINLVLLATNYIDTKFFDFEHKRLTVDVFSAEWLGEDFMTLLPAFIRDYWYLIIIWLAMSFGLYKFYPRLKSEIQLDHNQRSLKKTIFQIIIFILLMGIGLLFGRGGFQLKPLRVIHAAEYTSAKNIPLVLNTPFTIMKSFGSKNMEFQKYFDQDELASIYSPIKKYSSHHSKNQNIVVIILESFSKEYIGELNNGSGYTPFLDSLIKESLVFTNAFANGKRSMEAMPSIIAGLPALTDETYITSRYASNQINSITTILNQKGYHSAFFHGGKNGTMGFDKFAEISGFNEYFGMNEYPYDDYDGNWGIYDEPYLRYFSDKLSEFEEPFFASIFTLTSHHPYEIPKKYNNKFPTGTLNIHESIGYTDFALKQFFQKARKAPWFSNTLFIITADHTAQAEKAYYKNKLGNYAIPILFYHSTDSLFKGNSDMVAQQTDIFPTIIDYLGINEPFICFGNSLLSGLNKRFTVNYINGVYQLYKDDYLLQFDGGKSIGLYNVRQDSLLQNNLVDHINEKIYLENYLKAVIQSYQQRVVSNNLTIN